MEKIIHQIWVGPHPLPENESAWSKAIRNSHPDYEYYFWNDSNLPELPEGLQAMVDVFTEYKEWIRIADMLRYYVVWKYGGVYIDADYELINPIEDLKLENYKGFVPLHYAPGETICNSIFGFEKNHPIITDRVDELLEIAKNVSKWDNLGWLPWFGPHFFGQGLKRFIGADPDEVDTVIAPILESEWGIKTIHSREELKLNYLAHQFSYNWGPGLDNKNWEGVSKPPEVGTAPEEQIDCPKWNQLKQVTNRDHLDKYVEVLDTPTICEIGVRVADNFRVMLTDNVEKAVAVDIWRDTGNSGQNDWLSPQWELDNQYRHVFRMYLDNPKVKIIREFGFRAAEFFDNETFDFVYIDADHTYEGCLEDIKAWYPKVKLGGVIGGHDYVEHVNGFDVKFGVLEAVNEFRLDNNVSDARFHTTGQEEHFASWFIYKK